MYLPLGDLLDPLLRYAPLSLWGRVDRKA